MEDSVAEIKTRQEGAVGMVIFSNPAKFNAMTYDMWCALPQAVAQFERDDAVRVVVLSGEGERAFIAGADISQFGDNRATPQAQQRYASAVDAAYNAPILCRKPTIARIRGICVGGGLGLAAACDVRIAADNAVFRMPAARLGLGYQFAGLRRFVDLIGAANTADIFFSARNFDAADALRMGFVSRVLPPADLEREVAAYCDMIAENAPLTVSAAKAAIFQANRDPEVRDLAGLQRMVDACFASEDYAEGCAAFAEKRKPIFRGK